MGEAKKERNYNLETTALVTQANEHLEVTNDNQQVVIDLGSAMNALKKEIDLERKDQGEPLRLKVKAINDTFNPMIESLAKATDRLRDLVKAWRKKLADEAAAVKARLQAEEKARLKAAADAEAAGKEPEPPPPIREVAPPPPANVAKGAFGSVTGRKVWKAEVTDLPVFLAALLNGDLPMLKMESVLTVNLETLKSASRMKHKFDPARHGIRTWQETEETFK